MTNNYSRFSVLFIFVFSLSVSINPGQINTESTVSEAILEGHQKGVTDLAFSASGNLILSSSLDGTVRIWDFTGKETKKIIGTENGEVYALAVSPDGKLIASAGQKGRIIVNNAETGKVERIFSDLKDWSQTVAFSPDGKQIAATSGNGTICIWQVKGSEEKRVINSKSQPTTLVWSPDGKYLVSGFFNITFWNAENGHEIKTLKGHNYTLRSISFSKDGKLLASASLDKTVRIWDVEKGTVLKIIQPKGFARYWQGKAISDPINVPILAAEFSPDGKQIATAGAGRLIHFWEVDTGKLIKIYRGHRKSITALKFSHDGKYLASSSLDRTIRLWNISVKEKHASPQTSETPDSYQIYQIYKKGIEENNYLESFLQLQRKETEFVASPQTREIYFDYMAQLASFIGDIPASYSYEEKLLAGLEPRNKSRARNAKETEASPFADYQPHKALDVIDEAALKYQIIIINEEHRTPVHRALTHRLLPILYKKGFRYFAAETLNGKDTELNERGFPTQKTGFYTADPLYADVIRQAIKLGFKVIPYEHDQRCAKNDPNICQNERERGQAQNLYDRILKNEPKAKIFIHVGRAHAAKISIEGAFAFMAWHLQKISGIEPYTIDQVRYSERKNPADEVPVYRYAANKKLLLNEPTVFQSREGKFYNELTGYDLQVFTPRTNYVNGRPSWLQLDGARKVHRIKLAKLNLQSQKRLLKSAVPVLVQAFINGESADAVPIDQIILYPEKEITVLMLPKDSIRIRAINETGKLIGEYQVKQK